MRSEWSEGRLQPVHHSVQSGRSSLSHCAASGQLSSLPRLYSSQDRPHSKCPRKPAHCSYDGSLNAKAGKKEYGEIEGKSGVPKYRPHGWFIAHVSSHENEPCEEEGDCQAINPFLRSVSKFSEKNCSREKREGFDAVDVRSKRPPANRMLVESWVARLSVIELAMPQRLRGSDCS